MKSVDLINQEKNKSKKYAKEIAKCLKVINRQIVNLQSSKNHTDYIAKQLEIECYTYNNVDKMENAKDSAVKHVKKVLELVNKVSADNKVSTEKTIKRMKKLNEILKHSYVQLKDVTDINFENIEHLQVNAIKKAVNDKFTIIRSDVDAYKVRNEYAKIQNRGAICKIFDRITGRESKIGLQKENLFAVIKGIDDSKENINPSDIPQKEYQITDILADINLWLQDNENNKEHKEKVMRVKDLGDAINRNFVVNGFKLKRAINKKEKARYQVVINKSYNKLQKENIKILKYFNKSNGCLSEKNILEDTSMKTAIEKLSYVSKNISQSFCM